MTIKELVDLTGISETEIEAYIRCGFIGSKLDGQTSFTTCDAKKNRSDTKVGTIRTDRTGNRNFFRSLPKRRRTKSRPNFTERLPATFGNFRKEICPIRNMRLRESMRLRNSFPSAVCRRDYRN